jgi:biopolymer transport protein ExbD
VLHLPKPRPLSPAIPAAALADVALLLVFFFLLSTRFAPDRSGIDLPKAPGLHEAAPGAVSILVERRVGAALGDSLVWRVETGPADRRDLPGPEALYFEASRIVDKDPERTFLLRIDAKVRFAVVDDVLETLRKAGVRNVVLGADPATGGA